MTDGELVGRIHRQEQAIRFWRGLALSLAGALALLLAIGAVAGVSLYSEAAAQRDRAMEEMQRAEDSAQAAREAVQEALMRREKADQQMRKLLGKHRQP